MRVMTPGDRIGDHSLCEATANWRCSGARLDDERFLEEGPLTYQVFTQNKIWKNATEALVTHDGSAFFKRNMHCVFALMSYAYTYLRGHLYIHSYTYIHVKV